MRQVPDLPYVSCCNFVCTSGHKLHRVPYDTFISCCLASEKLPTTACVVAVGGTRVRLMNQRITAQIPDEVLERHKMSRSFVSGWAGWLGRVAVHDWSSFSSPLGSQCHKYKQYLSFAQEIQFLVRKTTKTAHIYS